MAEGPGAVIHIDLVALQQRKDIGMRAFYRQEDSKHERSIAQPVSC